MACSFFTRLLGLILFVVPSTLAGIYITEPWAETVWTAGQCQTLSWKGDGNHPYPSGPGVADLHDANDGYLASVHIDDLKSGAAVACLPDPCSLHYEISHYFVRIVMNRYSSWSHSFTIKNTDCRSNLSSHSNHPQAFAAIDSQNTPSASAASNSSLTSETSSLTSSDGHSTLTASSPTLGLHSKPSIPTASTVSADPLSTVVQPAGFGLKSSRNSASNRLTKNGHWFDFEKIKFRLVFIVWPALVGISMAM